MTYFPPDHLDGARLMLRLPVPDDDEALYHHVTSDRDVTRYLQWTPHPDLAMTRRVIAERFNATALERTWAIVERDSGDVIGIFICNRRPKHSVEFGSLVGKRWWGEGLATEAANMMRQVVLADPSLYRVWATCSVENKSCAQSLREGGLALEGTLTRHVVYPNLGPEPRDSYLFGMGLR